MKNAQKINEKQTNKQDILEETSNAKWAVFGWTRDNFSPCC